MGRQIKARNSVNANKTINTKAIGNKNGHEIRPVPAAALSIIFFIAMALLAVQCAQAADPGHPASSVSAGTFEAGDFVFPDNLAVNKFLIVNGSTLYVDALNERVGIGTTSPTTRFDVNGSMNITDNMTIDSGTLFVDSVNNKIGIGTTSPETPFHVISATAGDIIKLEVDGGASILMNEIWSSSATNAPAIKLQRNAGSKASPTAILDTYEIGNIRFFGRFGTETGNVSRQAELKVLATENWNDTNRGAEFVISGTSAGSTTKTDWMTLIDGKIGIGTASPTQKLDINGSLNISDGTGKIYTPEICLAGSCQSRGPRAASAGRLMGCIYTTIP